MATDPRDPPFEPFSFTPDSIAGLMKWQADAARQLMNGAAPFLSQPGNDGGAVAGPLSQWQAMTAQTAKLWEEQLAQLPQTGELPGMKGYDPARWNAAFGHWWSDVSRAAPQVQGELWADTLELWNAIGRTYGTMTPGQSEGVAAADLPRRDRRFADPKWRADPAFALLHQSYLLVAEKLTELVEQLPLPDEHERARLRFATRTALEALSPDHFPLTNPLVLDKMAESGGQSLARGMENMLADIKRGQLTHVDAEAFELGVNLATTPGKVVHKTDLYELIQYTPTTDTVLEIPLLIFPPWINRFYILDLNEKKSFVRWALDQGISVFMVSWKSADAGMADVEWDDYIAAQIDAIDTVRERLDVKQVHTIGYCVAGTTLAATLAVMAAKGQADKVASATYFTAQVDFEKAGELKVFIDDQQLDALAGMAQDGVVDGRFLAATFNLLRSTDLIWNYVTNNYLLGEDYPAFDLLHWNGDVTNLPAKWHQQYLRDLYRDNKLVQPGALKALGEPIDLTKVTTPTFIQAGKEDHIAPAESVYRMAGHFIGPVEIMLAGSGHIAGVVNPPDAKKYQYWTNTGEHDSLDAFRAAATETPGSWWPYWLKWLRSHGEETVKVKGRRKPGGKGEKDLEEAPGTYVKTR